MKQIVFLGAALMAVLPALGHAADASAPVDAGAQPEVVVTATRTPEPADATGASVTVVTRQQIAEHQYQTVADALQQVPGMAVPLSGTPGQTAGVFTRGLNTNQTLVMVNGHRLPQGSDGAFDLTNLALDNVERIEVVRGPLSAVQGGNASGGVVNIITRDGRGLEKPEYSASFESGSYNTFHEAVTAVGAKGPFDYSVGASLLDTSWQRHNNDYERGNVDATLGYQAAKDVRLSLGAFYHSAFTQDPGSLTSPSNTNWELHETWELNPTVEWKTTEDWTQTFSYLRSQQRLQSDSSFGYTRSQANNDQANYDTSYALLDNLKFNGGGEFSDQNFWLYENKSGTRTYDNDLTNTAGYVGLDWEPLKDWHIVPTGRVDHYSDYGTDLNGRIASSYRVPKARTLLHASYGTSTTPPGEQNFQSFSGFQIPNPNLKPEQTQGFDAGVEQPFFDGKWTVGATYFQNNVRNLIYAVTDPSTFISNPQNVDQARTQGVELTSAWHPIAQLDINAGYTYLDAENLAPIQDFNAVTIPAGGRLIRRPRNTTTFSVTGRPAKGLSLTLEGNWFVDSEDFDANGVPAHIPDYFIARAAATWQVQEHVQLFGRIENAFNEKYQQVSGYPSPDQAFYGGVKLTY